MSNSTCPQQNLKVKHVVTLFEEVQNRYVNKLLSINEKHITVDERHKQKIAIYESYVKDLSLQSRLLLQSLEELEKEANQRVGLLENKLKKAQASLQNHHSSSDLSKTVGTFENEIWKLTHENLDMKHDLDSLASFINLAKRTGKWNTKQLQLKTLPLDCITGITNDKIHTSVPLHKEIQHRDEHIQVLQAEIEHLKKIQTDLSKQRSNLASHMDEDELKEQNLVLSKKADDLRSKLAEECQNTETYKMDIRLKTNQLNDLQEESNQKKQQYEAHVHDLSTKLKTISDRHRESTAIINNDVKIKKQQIEQLTQQVEQVIDERNELQKQCRVKDTITVDLEAKVRNLERQLTINNHPVIPIESTVSKIEYDKVEHELHIKRKQLDEIMTEIKTTDALNNKLEQDLRFFKKFHDEQFEQQIKTAASDVDQLQAEIRTLKRTCEEKTDQFHKQSLELHTCQEHLSIEHNKNTTTEQDQRQLRNLLQISNDQLENFRIDLKQSSIKNDQLEQTIDELNSRNNLLERKLIETMTLIDSRNKTLIDYEQQIDKIQNDLSEKQKEILNKQSHIDELEKNLINKTGEVAQLIETHETDLVKNQQREKLAEDNAMKALNDIKILQRELRHLSESLVDREHINAALNDQLQQFRIKQDEFPKIEKSLNKQLVIKQEQLVRYDQNLHEAEIKWKYAKEECLIQEKEIVRLNTVQEEQENRIQTLQQELLKLQEQRDTVTVQYERSEGDLRNIKLHREDENRKYSQEFQILTNEIATLKTNEVALLKAIDELKENLLIVSNERNQIQEQNNNYQSDFENIQKILYDETESSSKSAAKVILLARQFDEEQKRANHSIYQLNDIQMQLTSALIKNDTLTTELSQARLLAQEYIAKETDFKQNTNRINSLLDERNKSLDDHQREIETLNHLLSHLQTDYEKSKNDLSVAHDQIVHCEIGNETIKQHLTEKTHELSIVTNRLQEIQQDFHTYEKEHRYSNEEYLEHAQRKKTIENELTTIAHSFEKFQKEHAEVNEQLNKCRYDLEETEKSDIAHKERLMQSMDEAKIYKQKLALLGDCFKTVVRKASETSDQWANTTTHLDEQIVDLYNDVDKLHSLDERFEQSLKIFTQLRGQHEDLLVQFLLLKSILEKLHSHFHEYKHKCARTNDENHHLRIENSHLHEKIDHFHRSERLMHAKTDEQEISLGQLRNQLNHELQAHSEAQRTIEQLKHTLDETTFERDQLMKNITLTHKKVEKLQNDISGYTTENRLLQQTTQKLEKQLATTHTQNEALEKNKQSYKEKINECESLLIELTETNKSSLYSLEQKKTELNIAQSEIQTLKYEHSSTASKLEKFEETNQEFQRHISVLERSIEEYKRLVRKREKELEQIKNDFEHKMLNASTLNNKCTKQDTEISVLRMENVSLNEELRLMRENVYRCQEEQRRLKNGCDQALNFIQDGIPDMCLNDENNNKRNEISQECVMQHVTGASENLKTKDTLWSPFVQDFTYDSDDCQSSQKKYKLMKAYSQQQQVLLTKLETHVQFYESIFEKSCLPAIEYSTATNLSNILDNNHHYKD